VLLNALAERMQIDDDEEEEEQEEEEEEEEGNYVKQASARTASKTVPTRGKKAQVLSEEKV
jgi:hypothetical protein